MLGKDKEKSKEQIPIDLKVAIAWFEEQKKIHSVCGHR
jgi:hypothetical protein